MKYLLIIATILGSVSCQTAYYKFWDTLGYEKRDLLEDGIEDLKDDQVETKESFEEALQVLSAKHGVEKSALSDFYDDLKSSYESAEKQSKNLVERVEKVENIAEDMFSEWRDELSEISDPSLRSDSEKKLKLTKSRFEDLDMHMQMVLKSLKTPLQKLKDRTLYIKHNLNAQSLKVFEMENKDIEKEVSSLIRSIQEAIQKSDKFLQTSRLSS